MTKRFNIVEGPRHYDFVFMLPVYNRQQDLLKRPLFFLNEPGDKSKDEGVILLTIQKAKWIKSDGVEGWSFEGLAGDRPCKGFFSTIVRRGWVEQSPKTD